MRIIGQTKNRRFTIMSYENLSDESSDVRKLTFTTSRRKGHLVGAYASFRDSEGKKIRFFRYNDGRFLQANCSYELENEVLASMVGVLQTQEEIHPEALDVFASYLDNYRENPAYQVAMQEVQDMSRSRSTESGSKRNSR